jgi:hypothetical protein
MEFRYHIRGWRSQLESWKRDGSCESVYDSKSLNYLTLSLTDHVCFAVGEARLELEIKACSVLIEPDLVHKMRVSINDHPRNTACNISAVYDIMKFIYTLQ